MASGEDGIQYSERGDMARGNHRYEANVSGRHLLAGNIRGAKSSSECAAEVSQKMSEFAARGGA